VAEFSFTQAIHSKNAPEMIILEIHKRRSRTINEIKTLHHFKQDRRVDRDKMTLDPTDRSQCESPGILIFLVMLEDMIKISNDIFHVFPQPCLSHPVLIILIRP
jgi:hypothetical protein